jgi:hypothetical protein
MRPGATSPTRLRKVRATVGVIASTNVALKLLDD